jgi:broad specificity phosphatase PhoE
MNGKIFLLRHAKKQSGSGDIELSYEGRMEAQKLAKKFSSILKGENVIIWTSSAQRALETATIVKDGIKDDVQVKEFLVEEKLWSDNNHPYDFVWLKEKISSFNDDNLIIISHLEYVQEFPCEIGFAENNAGYAEGVLIHDGQCSNF